MRLIIKWWITIGLFIIPAIGLSQLKIGYVQSDRIRNEYEEFKEAENQLQLEFRKAQFEYQTMTDRLDSLKNAFETQRLMSSTEWKREREQEIADLEKQVQEYQLRKVGPEGELYQKQLQLESEIIQKVQKAVSKVAIDRGFDYILDSVSLLYAKPTHNLTDDVLYELRKVAAEEEKLGK